MGKSQVPRTVRKDLSPKYLKVSEEEIKKYNNPMKFKGGRGEKK